MKAQRPCLMRAKNLMALSYAALRGPSVYASLDVCSILFFYYNDIFGIKVAFRRDKLRRHSATMPTKCVAPHMLENSEWCSHTHTMLLTRNTRFTQQTLMQPLYVTLFIMLRGYLDEFQIAGAKKRYPANPKPSRSTYAKRVFIRGVAQLRRTREENALYYIKQRPLTAEAGS